MVATFQAGVEDYDVAGLLHLCGGPGWQVTPSRAAVLVHDVLPYYLSVLPEAVAEKVTQGVEQVVRWARQHDVPVLASAPRAASRLEQRGLGARLWGLGPNSDQARSSAVGLPDDAVWVGKRSYSAFFATDLDVELRRSGRDQLVIVGVFVSAGITATTFDALAHDIESFVVADATADYTARHAASLTHLSHTTAQILKVADLC